MYDPEDMDYSTLVCLDSSGESGTVLCELKFKYRTHIKDSEIGSDGQACEVQAEDGEEVHYATFTLYKGYEDALERAVYTRRFFVEKLLYHAIALAEKLRRRKLAGTSLF